MMYLALFTHDPGVLEPDGTGRVNPAYLSRYGLPYEATYYGYKRVELQAGVTGQWPETITFPECIGSGRDVVYYVGAVDTPSGPCRLLSMMRLQPEVVVVHGVAPCAGLEWIPKETLAAVEHARAADGWSNILSGYSPPRMATVEAVREAILIDCPHVSRVAEIFDLGLGMVRVVVDAPYITADADRRIAAINVKHAAERAMAAATHVSEVVVNGYRIEVSS